MRVIGLGDNVVDMYMHRNVMYPGGNAMNFAVYANLMGVESAYLGVFGSDDAAAHVMIRLRHWAWICHTAGMRTGRMDIHRWTLRKGTGYLPDLIRAVF